MGFSFTKGVIMQEMSMNEFEASLNMAESCDRCIAAGIGSNCDRGRCPIARAYDARMLYFEACHYREKMKPIYRKAQQTKQRIAKAREQAAAANAVKYLSSIFPELAGYEIQSFYPSYFGARERLQRELGCPVSDILVLAFLALEDVKTTAYALRRLKEVQIIERGIIDLSRVREIIREEEAEINRIKDLGLFIFGEDELQYV